MPKFRGLDEAIDKATALKTKAAKASLVHSSKLPTQDIENPTKHMKKLIEQQNENLKRNLNTHAITPIAIPEKFIKIEQDEDPMTVVASIIETRDGFLGYKILKVQGINWHFIM